MTRSTRPSSYAVALRLIHLMRLIPRRNGAFGGRIGAQALRRRLREKGFDVSLRTIQRDLHQLQATFPDLKNDGADQLGWYWDPAATLLDIPAMDAPLALAFKLAEQYLQPVAPTLTDSLAPYLDAAARALDEESQDWLSRIAIVPRSMPLQAVHLDSRVTSSVMLALLERKRLRVRYESRSNETAELELSPHGLVLRHEISYLVATAWDYTDLRHYALHRMAPETIEVLDTPATPLDDFDLQAYIDQGAFQYQLSDEPIHLVLRLRREVAYHLTETPLSADQHIEPEEDGWQTIHATVPDTQQLRWWLLSLGPNVEVLKPESLRQDIARSLHEAAARYIG